MKQTFATPSSGPRHPNIIKVRGHLPARAAQKRRSKRHNACSALARLRGFEPPTYRLGGGRSILLSYRRI